MTVNVLLSCDENPYYSDFWPMVKEIWKKRFDINPQLVYINDEKETKQFEDGVLHVKKIAAVPVHLQAQMARIYFTHLFPDEICLVSDIDMFPVSKSFFNKEKILQSCEKESFLHLNPERREFGQLPICYYCGYGSLYDKLRDGLSWGEFLKMIMERDFNTDNFNFSLPKHLEGKKLWFSDEIFLFSQISEKKIPMILREGTIGPRRMDRENILKVDFFNKLPHCVDIHLPRPYTEFKSAIDNIYYTLIL